MLHPTFMHIAYCCALLCSLSQFQVNQPARTSAIVAEAITIIIEGAKTSEWATRDQYDRLMEAAAAEEQAIVKGRAAQSHSPPAGMREEKEAEDEDDDELFDDNSGRETIMTPRFAHHRANTLDGGGGGGATIGNSVPRSLAAVGGASEERAAKLAGQRTRQASESELSPTNRAIMELVGLGDDMLSGNNQQLVSANDQLDQLDQLEALREAVTGHHRRQAAEKRYCGEQLNQILEFICSSSGFYEGQKPEIVEPTVTRNRRYVDLMEEDQEQVGKRRKSRKLAGQQQDIDDLSNHHNNNEKELNHDGSSRSTSEIHHNQQHQYLSPTSSASLSSSSISSTSSSSLSPRPRLRPSSATSTSTKSKQPLTAQINSNNNFKSRTRATKSIARVKRGAHKECCLRPCDPDVLKAYCKDQQG